MNCIEKDKQKMFNNVYIDPKQNLLLKVVKS